MCGVSSHCVPWLNRQDQLPETGGEKSVCRSQVEVHPQRTVNLTQSCCLAPLSGALMCMTGLG